MCGICGASGSEEVLVKQMHECIAHRGPDASAVWSDKKVTLGHRRLAIIDLSKAAEQPMHYKRTEEHVVIVFNGEIYNFQDIKSQLQQLGYEFKTKSDTEVILASYLAWGPDCVNRFNGQWAFCIYDEKKQMLFCSRDRFGKKPFYYSTHGGKLYFASELKAFHAIPSLKLKTPQAINNEAIGLYFGLGFIPSPYTIYNSILKLAAGHNLLYDLKKKQIEKVYQYYTLPDYAPTTDKKKLIAEGRALLKDATRLRLIADVPVGAFLSGGLDSSTVVAEMANFTDLKKLHTFSVGFTGTKDETQYMNIVTDAFHTMHHHVPFSREDMLDFLKKQADIYDEPYSDISGLPIAKMSRETKKFVTVALSGDGGDEIFGGYTSHVTGRRMDFLRALPSILQSAAAKMPAKKNLEGFFSAYTLKQAFKLTKKPAHHFYSDALDEDIYLTEATKHWMREKLAYCLRQSGDDLAEALRLYDLQFHTIPDHFLVKVDRASMAYSLEVRSPFLDYRLAEYSQKIPRKWKLDTFNTKKLMREIIKGIVPDSIVNRKKQGFTNQEVEQWFYGPLCDEAQHIALGALLKHNKQLHAYYTNKVLTERNRLYNSHRIRLIMFGLWWKRWMP